MKAFIKILRILILIIIFGIIKNIRNIKVEEVRKGIKEIIYSYYMRGKNIQYGPKSYYYPPEEVTRQNLNFLSCSHFTTSVYLELISTRVTSGCNTVFNYSEVYIGKRPEVVLIAKKNEQNNLEMKYYAKNESVGYKTAINPDFQTLLSLLEIGDILVEPDHFLIIYDIIKDNSGNKIDAVLIHSMSGSGNIYIRTKVPRYQTPNPKGDEYSKEQYTIFLTGKLNSNFEEGMEEATIRAVNLSKYSPWGNMSLPKYRNNTYAILRIIQENDKGQAILKYIDNTSYKSKYIDNDIIELVNKNLDRIKFKHLYIEKIVDKNAGSVVQIGDFLTYSIIIKNYGKENYKEDLIVLENLSQFVKYEKYYSNSSGIYFENNIKERQLKWNIGKLKSKEEKIINYTVKVISGNPYDIIENIGYVGNIPSSEIKNTIGINLNKNQKN